LIDEQIAEPERWAAATVNVGGGREFSLSLAETTEICRELSGNTVPIEAVADTRYGDVPIYLSDCSDLFARTDWRPRLGPERVLEDVFAWIESDPDTIAEALGLDVALAEGARR
jgi:CDP-paratose 2-epimerase